MFQVATAAPPLVEQAFTELYLGNLQDDYYDAVCLNSGHWDLSAERGHISWEVLRECASIAGLSLDVWDIKNIKAKSRQSQINRMGTGLRLRPHRMNLRMN